MRNVFTALIGLSLCLSAFLGAMSSENAQGGTMKISSDAFAANETIPKKFTCDGPDASPKLTWSEPPAKTQSFALIMDDPDAPAGTWVHWVLFDLPAETRELAEGVAKQEQLANGARQGRNDFGKIGKWRSRSSLQMARGRAATTSAKSATVGRAPRRAIRTAISSSCTRSMPS